MNDAGSTAGDGKPAEPLDLRPTLTRTALRWFLVLPAIGLGFLAGLVVNSLRFSDASRGLGPLGVFLVSGIGSVAGVAFGCAAAPGGKRWVGWASGLLIAGVSATLLAAPSLGWRDLDIDWLLAGAGLGGVVAAMWAWRSGGVIDLR